MISDNEQFCNRINRSAILTNAATLSFAPMTADCRPGNDNWPRASSPSSLPAVSWMHELHGQRPAARPLHSKNALHLGWQEHTRKAASRKAASAGLAGHRSGAPCRAASAKTSPPMLLAKTCQGRVDKNFASSYTPY